MTREEYMEMYNVFNNKYPSKPLTSQSALRE